MATRITITTNEGSSNYTLSTGARGPAGAAGATGPSPAALEFAGSDPNIPDNLTIIVDDGTGPETVVLPRVADVNNFAAWSGDGWQMTRPGAWSLYRASPFALVAGSGGNTPLNVTLWLGGGLIADPIITGDAPTATHIGQWCQASTAWWQWNGTLWQPIRTTEGQPITVDSDGKFYRQFIYDSGFGPAQAFEEITF